MLPEKIKTGISEYDFFFAHRTRMKKRKRRRKMKPRTCWEEVLGQHYLQKGHE